MTAIARQPVASDAPASACHVWWCGGVPGVAFVYRLRRKPSSRQTRGVVRPGLVAAYLEEERGRVAGSLR